MNVYSIYISLLRIYAIPNTLRSVLDSFGQAVRKSSDNITKAEETKDDEYISVVVDDECEIVESLIGAAFVSCQTITNAVSAKIKSIHKRANSEGQTLSTTDGKKHSILKFGSDRLLSSNYSQIQAINAFANYFKHCDEWTKSWTNQTDQNKLTIEIIVAAGASQGSSGNLRTGIKALEIFNYEKLTVLSNIVEKWTNALLEAYETELRSASLI